MRKLSVLFAAVALVVGVSSQASAATVTGGSLSLGIGALPPITIGVASGGSVTGTSGNFSVPASIAGPTNVLLPVTLFTGVPSISGLSVVGLANPALSVVGGAAGGGVLGQVNVNVLQFAALPIPLAVVGATTGATTAMASLGAIIITVVGGGDGWTTGAAQVSGIVTTTPGTAVVNTVTASGSNNLSGGSVTLVSGFKAITSVGFILPGFVTLAIQTAAIPEPGTLLLLGTGVVGLAAVGRRRMRK